MTATPPAAAGLALGRVPEGATTVEEVVRADVSWAPGDPPAPLTVRCDDARVTLLLAGDEGSYISGARVAVTGGRPIL